MSKPGDTVVKNRRPRRKAASLLSVGSVFDGKLALVEKLGQGQFGCVFLADHQILDEQKVVKILDIPNSYDEEAKTRFLREAQIAVKLKHENIIQVDDACISQEGYPYILMPYLKGQTLGQWIKDNPLPTRDFTQIAQIIVSICRGLAAAHENNCIHRDIKPANVFLHDDIQNNRLVPIILDFGVARNVAANEVTRLSVTGQTFGTVGYMSPEQARGEDPGKPSDIFSTGAILYELITGVKVNPFDKTLPPQKRNPDIPSDIGKACMRALEPNTSKRYPRILDFADDLSTTTAIENQFQPKPKYSAMRIAIISIVCTLAVVILGYILWNSPFNTPPVNADSAVQRPTQITSSPSTQRIAPKINPKLQFKKNSATKKRIKPPQIQRTPNEQIANQTDTDTPHSSGASALDLVAPKEKASNQAKSPPQKDEPKESEFDIQMRMAKQFLVNKDFIKAKQTYKRALKIRPNAAEAWFGLGMVAKGQKKYPLASTQIEMALQQKNRADWRLELAMIFWIQGLKEKAYKEWTYISTNVSYRARVKRQATKYLEKYY